MKLAIAIEAENFLAFTVIVEAVARVDFKIGLVLAKGVEFDFAMLFDLQGGNFPFLGSVKFCLEFIVFAFLRIGVGDHQTAERQGRHKAEESICAFDNAYSRLHTRKFLSCELGFGHVRVWGS